MEASSTLHQDTTGGDTVTLYKTGPKFNIRSASTDPFYNMIKLQVFQSHTER